MATDFTFKASLRGEELGSISLAVPGNYNVDNALGALAILHGAFGLSFDEIAPQPVPTWDSKIVSRCVELVSLPSLRIISVIQPAWRVGWKASAKCLYERIWCVFKPYRFTLDALSRSGIRDCLSGADEVVITKMYAAEGDQSMVLIRPGFVMFFGKKEIGFITSLKIGM